ncbi:hypothetical protein BD413DRAFT_499745 [Trametes elegans]|nr:hypothetical protein BD413DRAFT_499745 [Trametes elegans]
MLCIRTCFPSRVLPRPQSVHPVAHVFNDVCCAVCASGVGVMTYVLGRACTALPGVCSGQFARSYYRPPFASQPTTMSSAGKTAQDPAWKSREQAAEGQYARAKEAEALQALRDELAAKEPAQSGREPGPAGSGQDDIEGGYGGQEELEDRYATTYGMH